MSRKNIKNKNRTISLRWIFIIAFSILIIITAGGIGAIVFTGWFSSADKTVAVIAKDNNAEILSKVNTFLLVPTHINEVNSKLLENGIIDFKNEAEREIFFVGVLLTHFSDPLYSFSYGTEIGEYYGARKNEKNEIEIMRNNADTGGNSWYYSVTDEMTAGELALKAGKFDPRTREWYKAAKKAGKPIFSAIYKHFVMDDLTVSAATPIYNEKGELQGVMGSHITLSRIDSFLKESTEESSALAVIVDKNTGELIANSLGIKNFEVLADKSIKRATLAGIGSQVLFEAFNRYRGSENENYKISSDSGRFYTDIARYSKDGLEWLVITAIPEKIFISAIYDSMKLILYLTLLSMILSLFVYLKLIGKFLKPINNLKAAAEKLALGDLAQRAKIIRNDEIGEISDSFNKMADTISTLVNGLETKVRERTAELENSNTALEENSEILRITLFSVGHGFISTDQFENIVTINNVAESLTGWYQEEAIGKPFEEVFNIIKGDNGEKCYSLVREVFETGKIIIPEDHMILVSKDGTETSIEVSAALISDEKEKMFGVVVAFRDCSEKREKQTKIEYLGYHDPLTGLYNRRFYDEELRRLDTERNLPIALIMLDVNGLKLINDAFGHKAGDQLLKKISSIMKMVCRNDEIITKIGGDEFIILLPKTDLIAANKLIARINDVIKKEKIDNIILSASMGCAVKQNKSQSMDEVFKEAEDDMYRRKLSESASMRSKNIDLIINSLFEKNSTEMTHSKRVGELCESIAKNMDFQEDKLIQMRTAGLMHDIGKINVEDNVLNKKGKLQDNDWGEIKRHPEIGYRILSSANEFSEIANFVLAHHERWDGQGYPKGIKGEAIPVESRIIAIADAYEAMTTGREYQNILSEDEAASEIIKYSGFQFDPAIARVLVEKVMGKEWKEKK